MPAQPVTDTVVEFTAIWKNKYKLNWKVLLEGTRVVNLSAPKSYNR